jgi:predicted ATPase/DNA-binding SARP family transcriptional activator
MPLPVTAGFRIRMFGPFQVEREGQPLPRLRSRKGHWLLGLLVLRHGREVERSWLAGTLWPDSPALRTLANLRNTLLDLRRALGPEAGRLLAPSPRTLALDLAGAAVDLLQFDTAVARADLPSLQQAVALYQGPLLEGCAEEWIFQERQVREAAYLRALETLAGGAMAECDAETAAGYLRQAVAVDPLREQTQRALMEALAAGGNVTAAMATYRDLRLRLHHGHQGEPDPETQQLYERIRAAARRKPAAGSPCTVAGKGEARAPDNSPGAGSAKIGSPPHNLPLPLSSFVGRESQISELKQWLAGPARLVTLTGVGGAGKTRLALEVAAGLPEEYADGIWLVELASLADASLVPQAVAAALGVWKEPGAPITPTLVSFLKPRQLLLVLDNCEHLIGACAQLATVLLQACPNLQILATSREVLGVTGEVPYRVPPLSVPEAGPSQSLENLTRSEAVRLFLERAVTAPAGFTLTDGNAPWVAQICQQLDGLPLAIELAAARVRALPVEEIAARLADRFRLLRGSRTALPRQQTLRALMDWSYDLLSEAEQTLLRHLSVFSGGWTLEAAEAVGAGEGVEAWEVADRLTQLVEKSLVLYEPADGQARYRLLETVRQYARDRLLEAGNAAAARDRHRDWFVVLAERAKPHLQQGAEQRAWMERLARERDNLRAALAWCLEAVESDQERVAGLPTPPSAAVEAGLRLVGALTWFWIKRGHLTEEWQRVVSLLAAGHGAPAAVRGKALVCAMMIARYEDDWPTTAALAAEGLALGREGGDNWLAAASLLHTGVVAQVSGDLERAQALGEEGLALARAAGDGWIVSVSLARLAEVAEGRGDDAVARVLHQEVLDRFRQAEDTGGIAAHLGNLAGVARREGNYEQARALLEEATALTQEGGERKHHLYLLMCLADLVLIEGDYEPAKARYQEALAIAQELGDTHWTADALVGLARTAQALGDHDQARALLEEAHPVGQGTEACMGEGHLLLDLGDYAAARSCYEEGLALRRTGEQTRLIAYALLEVGHAAWLQGEPGVTQSHAVEALGLFQAVGDKAGILAALENLAVAALAQRRKERAARLLGAVAVLCEAPGLTWPEWRRRPRERIGEAVHAASLEQEFAAAWAAGRALSLPEAVDYALQEADDG